MKTIGWLAKDFRQARGWSYTRMAREVEKAGGLPVSRQAITQLEDVGDRRPHYLPALAKVMGTTADSLMAGQPGASVQPSVLEITVPNAVATVASTLQRLSPIQREQAVLLLTGMAREPDGPWLNWLADFLIQSPAVVLNPTDAEAFSDKSLRPAPQRLQFGSGAQKSIFNLGEFDGDQAGVVKKNVTRYRSERVQK